MIVLIKNCLITSLPLMKGKPKCLTPAVQDFQGMEDLVLIN